MSPDSRSLKEKFGKIGSMLSTDAHRLLLRDADAVVEWFVGVNHVYTFVISRSEMRVFVGRGGTAKLISASYKYHSQRMSNRSDWMMNMEEMLYDIGFCLNVDGVAEYLKELKYLRVIFVPHWFLHAIPLHAIPLDSPTTSSLYYSNVGDCFKDKRRFMDIFPKGIRYAPSCRVLLMTFSSEEKLIVDSVKCSGSAVCGHGLVFENLVGINNPGGGDSKLSCTELDCIQRVWKSHKFVFSGDDARLELFVGNGKADSMWNVCECLHFNCHGSFNISRPMESGLLLARNDRLLLRDIFSLHLPNCKLVTLSACETGLIDIENVSDEYVGLPSAFLFAGASHTVGSLWSVYDTSTTVLMVKFYEILKQNKKISIPEALWRSQQWYRKLDYKKRIQIYSGLVGASNAQKLARRETFINPFSSFLAHLPRKKQKSVLNVSQYPRHPVHWAAFICVG